MRATGTSSVCFRRVGAGAAAFLGLLVAGCVRDGRIEVALNDGARPVFFLSAESGAYPLESLSVAQRTCERSGQSIEQWYIHGDAGTARDITEVIYGAPPDSFVVGRKPAALRKNLRYEVWADGMGRLATSAFELFDSPDGKIGVRPRGSCIDASLMRERWGPGGAHPEAYEVQLQEHL